MPSKGKQRREFRKLCDDLCIEVIDCYQKRNHEKWTLRNQHGVQTKYTVPVSASDHRAELNRRADLRRFASQRA